MNWKSIGKAVGKFAPILGTALGSPVAGGLISVVANQFGLGEDEVNDNPELLMNAIKGDPDAQMKLLKIQTDHEATIEQIVLQRDLAHLADRADARSASVARAKATGKPDTFLNFLAVLVVLGFFGLTFTLVNNPPEKMAEAVFILFGSVSTAFGAVIHFFFGSSGGSKKKTQLLNGKK